MVVRNRLHRGHGSQPTRRPGARSHAGNGSAKVGPHPLQRAWRSFGIRLPRLRTQLGRLAALQIERLRLSAADVTLRLVLGSTLVLTIAAVATMATTMTLVGLAGGLSVLLGGNLWLAAILAGSAALMAILVAVWSGLRWHSRRRMADLRRRHEPEPAAADAVATPPQTAANGHAR